MALHNLNINFNLIIFAAIHQLELVILDTNLNFKEHIRKIQLKLSHVIYILRKLSYSPIYFKVTLKLFVFASYHVLFRHFGK